MSRQVVDAPTVAVRRLSVMRPGLDDGVVWWQTWYWCCPACGLSLCTFPEGETAAVYALRHLEAEHR